MEKSAIISNCGIYRYELRRHWDHDKAPLPVVMLNPSTADADKDDPTIRRLIGFAKRDGFGGIIVVNLHAYRATAPRELFNADDPYGPMNDEFLQAVGLYAIAINVPIVCAWGFTGAVFGKDEMVVRLFQSIGAQLFCYGQTRDGFPRHPLYLAKNRPLIPFNWSNKFH